MKMKTVLIYVYVYVWMFMLLLSFSNHKIICSYFFFCIRLITFAFTEPMKKAQRLMHIENWHLSLIDIVNKIKKNFLTFSQVIHKTIAYRYKNKTIKLQKNITGQLFI